MAQKWEFNSVYLRNKKKNYSFSLNRPPLRFPAHGRSRPGLHPRLPRVSPWPAALRRPRPTPRPLPRADAPAFPACPATTRRPYTGGEGRCLLRPAALRLQSDPNARTPPHSAISLRHPPYLSLRSSSSARAAKLADALCRRRAPAPPHHPSIRAASSSASSTSVICARQRLPSSR